MQVLAKRSSSLIVCFILFTFVLLGVWLLCITDIFYEYGYFDNTYSTVSLIDFIVNEMDLVGWFGLLYYSFFTLLPFFWFLYLSISIIRTPKIIMECDSKGIYVYGSRGKITPIRYEDLIDAFFSSGFKKIRVWYRMGFLRMYFDTTQVMLWYKGPGELRLETKDGFIFVPFISHVNDVRFEIKKHIYETKNEIAEEAEEIAWESQKYK